jgi:putative transposase
VSNDNPFSESCFKTVKSQPDFPGRFRGVEDSRRWCGEFFAWYADCHRHSALALFTPADVFFGRVEELALIRQQALDEAYAAHPERFVRGRPTVKLPPARVYINPLDPDEPVRTGADVLASSASQLPLPSNESASSEAIVECQGAAAKEAMP